MHRVHCVRIEYRSKSCLREGGDTHNNEGVRTEVSLGSGAMSLTISKLVLVWASQCVKINMDAMGQLQNEVCDTFKI